MSEASCHNCSAACCKGKPILMMQLSSDEVLFMRQGGNRFLTVTDPVDCDREDVIYPAGIQINQERNTFNWLVEKGREYEKLPAGFGRYALVGACQYLVTDENGWEHCGVYDERPNVCRDFETASEKCLTLRELHDVPLPDPVRK